MHDKFWLILFDCITCGKYNAMDLHDPVIHENHHKLDKLYTSKSVHSETNL